MILGAFLLLMMVFKIQCRGKMKCYMLDKEKNLTTKLLRHEQTHGKQFLFMPGSSRKGDYGEKYIVDPNGIYLDEHPSIGPGFFRNRIHACLMVEGNAETIVLNEDGDTIRGKWNQEDPISLLKYSGMSAKVIGAAYNPYAFEQFMRAADKVAKEKKQKDVLLVILVIVTIGLGLINAVLVWTTNGNVSKLAGLIANHFGVGG
jgi:hypothetical protein